MATAADGLIPRARPAGARPAAAAAMPMSARPEREGDEKEVVAEPRLDRSVFLYMAPRPGLDGADSFCQCGSCESFVPEASMHGAVVGDRCIILGSAFPITDDSSCGLFVPWAAGTPCGGCVAHNAMDLVQGRRGAARPWDVGFVSDTDVRCANCRQFDGGDSSCEFYECLNKTLPNIFALEEKVEPRACCNSFSKIPPPEPYDG